MRDDDNRIDELISAAMDDELDGPSRAELSRLIAEDETVAERVRRFHRVDGSLRELAAAADTSLDPRLAANFEALNARLESSGGFSAGTEVAPPEEASAGQVIWLRARVIPLLSVAAAAALALYLMTANSTHLEPSSESRAERQLAADEPMPSAETPIGDIPPIPPTRGSQEAADSEESLVWALGYVSGSEAEFISADLIEDFEVIEQLEVLEFLSARDAGLRSEAGRG